MKRKEKEARKVEQHTKKINSLFNLNEKPPAKRDDPGAPSN